MFVIRPAVDGDRKRISALIDECGDTGIIHISQDDSTVERFSRSLVACIGERILGYGSVSSRWLHPQRLRIAIAAPKGSEQNQVREDIFSHLILCIPGSDSRDLQASYWQSDLDACAFWDVRDFSPLMRTHTGTLDPQLVAESGDDIHGPLVIQDVEIVTGSEIGLDSPLWDEIAQLHEAIYRQNHAWNVPVQINVDLAKSLFLHEEDLIPETMHLALRSGRPVAVASLRPSTQTGRCDLGWIGIDDRHAGDSEIGPLLLAACLSDARQRGWLIDVEIDEADPILAPMLSVWPLQDLKTLVTVSSSQPAR